MGDLIDPRKARAYAERLWASASTDEREALTTWLHALVEVRDSDRTAAGKAVEAVRCTVASKAVWPVVKAFAVDLKRIGWDERSSKWRAFLGGSGAGLILFGSQGAGVAALGGAIGVPLWLVLGGGAAVLDALLDSSGPNDRGEKK